ncbi:MAG: GNAT family N-acetyltransferase [Oscillospiraceae bacterium]|jgi:8-oxo-dGTP pyrophosphatase MutT (NUDIX family)/GNAT superfamily N-acetyltransferase|nr:GNAT family N-acetyltransferase [Oscillospiraceae bacterium]
MLHDIKDKLHTDEVRRVLAPCLFDESPEGVTKAANRYLTDDARLFYGWVEGGATLGVVGFRVHGDMLEIMHIAVAEERRRQGIGARIIAALHDKYKLPLELETDDDAIDFYRKCGFSATAAQKYGVRRWECVLPVAANPWTIAIGLPEVPRGEPLRTRTAVRAVIRDGERALLILTVEGDYKFPGGGIKPDETHLDALRREVIEETGFVIADDLQPLGTTVTHRADLHGNGVYFEERGYYYECRLTGERGEIALDDYEKALHFSAEFVSLREAHETNARILERGNPIFWVQRETQVLRKLLR